MIKKDPEQGRKFTRPDVPAGQGVEAAQAKEAHAAGLEGEEEEWEEELTGTTIDNGFLPDQKMAEQGLDSPVWPEEES